jgi:hypothetical protein
MTRITVVALDIEDYFGTALENIEFHSPLELDPEEFTVRVDDFTFSGDERRNGGTVIRIQYDFEYPSGDFEKIEEIHSEIMEILLEGCDGELENGEEISDRIFNALEIIV